MSQEWLCRVFLAAPHSSERALAHSFKPVVGTDDCTVSRLAITRIRDAWVETFTELPHESARAAVHAQFAIASFPKAIERR